LDADKLGKVHGNGAKSLTMARNRSRSAASCALSTNSQFVLPMPAIPASKPYRVGRAKTGLGLFATQPIKKGTKIIRYFGPLLDCHKEKDDAVENKYLFQLNKRWTIDGSIRKNIARYINHSCKPNAESDVNPRKKKIIIRAIKNIEPGEEINYDYGTDYFKEYLKPIGCKCDSCEKKRKKQRAEARAERQRLKAKDEKKVAKKAEKDNAKSKVGKKAKAKSAAGKAPNSRAAKSPRKTAASSSAAKARAKAATKPRAAS